MSRVMAGKDAARYAPSAESVPKEERCQVCGNMVSECVCCPECGHVCAQDNGGLYCPVCGPAKPKA